MDNIFENLTQSEDNSLSYIGGASGYDRTTTHLHQPHCPNFYSPVETCSRCMIPYPREPSLSPPLPYGRPLPIIRERSPTPSTSSRTYAQAVSQGLGAHQAASPAVLAATHELRPHPAPRQTQVQTATQRPAALSATQRPSAAQIAQRRSYAQAAQRVQQLSSTGPQIRNVPSPRDIVPQPASVNLLQQSRLPSQGQRLYQDQPAQYGGRGTGQQYLAPPPMYPATPQRPTNRIQNAPSILMGNLADMLRPEYTNNPRDIDNLVQGTQIGGHRHPLSTQSSGNSTPITPASPGTMSIRSGSSANSRRTGSALRDRNLPYHCQTCQCTFAKPEDLRRHSQRAHTAVGQRPYPCYKADCDWAFIHPKDLRRHMEIHRPASSAPRERFNCPYQDCRKSYTRKDNLQRHMDKDHFVDSGIGLSPSMSRTTSQSSHYTPYPT